LTIQISKRRIQRLGGSSLIITLPKSWIRKFGLSAGDEVLVVDEGTHLRVMPSFPGAEARLKTLSIDKMYTSLVDLMSMAECAFAKGYDMVEVPLKASSLEEALSQLEEAERSDYVKSIQVEQDRALISLIDTHTSPSSILKYLRRTVIEILEDLASSEGVDQSGLHETVRSLLASMREFQRIMSKKGVSACQEAPVDPYTLGMLSSTITVFERMVRMLAERPLEKRRRVIEILVPILVSGLGGLLNGSVKRTSEARRLIEEAKPRIRLMAREDQGMHLVEAFLDSLDLVLANTMCNIIGKNSA